MNDLETISARKEFLTAKFSMDGYILTMTPRTEIPGADGKTWEELTRDYRVMEHTTVNLTALLDIPAAK